MIKNDVVRKLAHFTQNDYPVTSAYFMVNIKNGNHKTHLVELKKMIRYKKNTTYFKQLTEAEKKSVLDDIDRIINWFEVELDTAKHVSSICFCQSKSGFWKIMNLKIPLRNELVIQPKPYIYQLSQLFSEYRRYGVLLIDKSKARIFEQSLGDFKELFKVADNAPESVKVGGYQGRQERKVERNIHQGIIQHYKEVAQKMFVLNKSRDFNWIVLGGRRESIGEFRKYLHDYVDGKVTAVIEIEPHAPLNDVFEKVQKASRESRLKFEKELLRQFENQKKAGQTIEGIDAILPKLRDKWIDTILLNSNYQRKGVFCRHCNFLDLSPEAECPEHGGPLERTQNINEHILHMALQQGVNVQYIQQSMEKYGRMAALLRFPLR